MIRLLSKLNLFADGIFAISGVAGYSDYILLDIGFLDVE
jgi:hypothetical protein